MHQINLTLNFTLLQHVNLFAPEKLGLKDILLCEDKIVAISDYIKIDSIPNCKVHNFNGAIACPGFIDQHVHLIGGGGEAGPTTRTPEVQLSTLIKSGITSVVGLLGTDSLTRHPESLLAKTKALNQEGINAYMLTGAYTVPTPTITGNISKDITFINEIIGCKVAISDHRSSAPSNDELTRLSTESRVGGLLGNKVGITVFHLGNSQKHLEPLYNILSNSDVPINKLLPTHVNRDKSLFDSAVAYAKQGGFIEITSGIGPEYGIKNAIKPSVAIRQAFDCGVPMERITLSSDGNGSQPKFDENGNLIGISVAGFTSLWQEIRDLVKNENWCLSQALQPITSSVAKFLNIPGGFIACGALANIVILDDSLQIDTVFAKGRCMFHNKQTIVKGTFE